MSDEIKVCPFCGAVPYQNGPEWVFHPKAGCQLYGGFALVDWNRRAPVQPEQTDAGKSGGTK